MKQVCHTREKFLPHIVMMGRRMMLREIIGQVGFNRPPIETTFFFLASLSFSHLKCISINLVRFGCIFELITPSAVELLVWIGVFGCGCPILARMHRKYTAYLAFINSAPNYASAADETTTSITFAVLSMAPLFRG
jgi:hypothetical protein